jgi:hypothetical protein
MRCVCYSHGIILTLPPCYLFQSRRGRSGRSVTPKKNPQAFSENESVVSALPEDAIMFDLGIPYVSGRIDTLTDPNVMDEMAKNAPSWTNFTSVGKCFGGTMIVRDDGQVRYKRTFVPVLSITILDQHIKSVLDDAFAARLYIPDSFKPNEVTSFLFIQVPTAPPGLEGASDLVLASFDSANGKSDTRQAGYESATVNSIQEKSRVYAIKFDDIHLHNDFLQDDADVENQAGGLTTITTPRKHEVVLPSGDATTKSPFDFKGFLLDVSWEIPIDNDRTLNIGLNKKTPVSTDKLAEKMRLLTVKAQENARIKKEREDEEKKRG